MLKIQNVILATSLLVLASCGGGSSSALLSEVPAGDAQDSETNWQLAWSDEFTNNTLDASSWSHELGDGSDQGIAGWGNNELQFYRQENLVLADGILTINAREESFGGRSYTSSRIKTQGKRSFRYGRVDVRAKLPQGQGMWPAIWMLGENILTNPWPASGEIDIMEMIGGSGRENTVHGTIHWDNSGQQSSGGSTALSGATFSDDFHVFRIEWNANAIRWFVDGQQFHIESIAATHQSELRNEFFILLNVAVGGNWPGAPDASTVFPQQMQVDYIRVYQASQQ